MLFYCRRGKQAPLPPPVDEVRWCCAAMCCETPPWVTGCLLLVVGMLLLLLLLSRQPIFCYVSQYWWNKYLHSSKPGPCSAAVVMCDHGFVKRALAKDIRYGRCRAELLVQFAATHPRWCFVCVLVTPAAPWL